MPGPFLVFIANFLFLNFPDFVYKEKVLGDTFQQLFEYLKNPCNFVSHKVSQFFFSKITFLWKQWSPEVDKNTRKKLAHKAQNGPGH